MWAAIFRRAVLGVCARSSTPSVGWRRSSCCSAPRASTSGFADGHFDVVVLNSVVQYFPDERYLLDVLAQARRVLAPGGAIFVGDVRNLDLQAAWCASVELHRAPSSRPLGEIRRRAAQRELASERRGG